MDLVIDANILFSALIKNSFTAELLFREEITLFSPEYVIEEFMRYEDEILKKTSRTKEDFIQIMHILKEIINVIPKEEYSGFMQEGENISPDKDDAIYFALALKLKCGIWSNDKRLKEQNKINVYSTIELSEILQEDNIA